MKLYKDVITLHKNNRGCYILDTTKGCSSGVKNKENGCYEDCYAKNIAERYGFNFNHTVKRDFEYDTSQLYFFDLYDSKHEDDIIRQIKNIKMPFIRIGDLGDPSEDWAHTIKVCKIISVANKPIVIITKHWKALTDKLLNKIKLLDITINTSISALDNDNQIKYRLTQFYKLKEYCNSVLRIVSCDFNKDNEEGLQRSIIQEELFKHIPIIDTIFRPSINNPFVVNKVINVNKIKFLKANVLASVYNKDTYFGDCTNCPDMCGVTI